jgi:hypothetical protein
MGSYSVRAPVCMTPVLNRDIVHVYKYNGTSEEVGKKLWSRLGLSMHASKISAATNQTPVRLSNLVE